MPEKIVLAYSGGLDTSIIIPWLKENYAYDVIAMVADVGQGDDVEAVVEKAYKTGASKVVVENLREEFLTGYVWPALKAGAVYENKYLLGTSLARPVIAKHQVEVALREGATAVGTVHLQIKSWEMPRFKGVDSMDRPKVNNGSEIVIDHLAPGTYDLARYVEAGHHGLFADRTTVIIEAGKTAEAGFVRKEGTAVSGKITGIDENEKIESAIAVVHPAVLPAGERAMFAPTFDAVEVKDGAFKTSKLSPGTYTVQVDVYKPEPPSQVFRSGWRMPDYQGNATVNVPATGEAVQIVIEMKSMAKPEEPKEPGGKEVGGLDSTRRRRGLAE